MVILYCLTPNIEGKILYHWQGFIQFNMIYW